MALCINRPDVIKAAAQGFGIVGNDHVISPVFPLYSPIPQRQQNYAKARALLAAAGHHNGLNLTMMTASDYPELVPVATVAQSLMKPAGINVTLNNEPSSRYFGGSNDWLNAPLTVTNWNHRTTPSQFLNISYRTGAPYNASRWSNKRFDQLSNELDATLDPTKRKGITRQIETIMNDETPAIISYFSLVPRAMRSNVQGVSADASTYLDLSRASLS